MTKVLTLSCIKISKMCKKLFFCLLLAIVSFSCNSEKVTISPVSSSLAGSSDGNAVILYTERIQKINYASELTNLIASFPQFKNDAVDAEVTKLKFYLKDYINAIQSYNLIGAEKAHNNYERTYKKLQRLKVYLNPDGQDVLNRYLVRIKTNMNTLESQIQNDSIRLK